MEFGMEIPGNINNLEYLLTYEIIDLLMSHHF